MNAEEMKQWVGGLALSPDKKAMLLKASEDPEVSKVLGEHLMTRSDYSKRMDELAVERKKVEAEIAKNANYYSEVSTWKTGAEKTFKEKQQEAERLNSKLAAVKTRVDNLKATYGIEESDLNGLFDDGAAPTPAAAAAAAAAGATDRYDEIKKDIQNASATFPMIPATLMDLQTEHTRLFGNTVPFSSEKLVAAAMKAGKGLRETWETENKVAERRDELKTAEIRATIEKEFKEKEIAMRSEFSNPAARPVGTTVAPVLSHHVERPNADAPKDPNRGIRGAVSAWGQTVTT